MGKLGDIGVETTDEQEVDILEIVAIDLELS
jgi:hypothetical protein